VVKIPAVIHSSRRRRIVAAEQVLSAIVVRGTENEDLDEFVEHDSIRPRGR